MPRWNHGEVIVRREVRNDGRVWAEMPVFVVRDEPDLLATYVAAGAPFTFPAYPEPHPWSSRSGWEGHGMLALQRPDDPYAVFVFWHGPEREFDSWYINFQEPFDRRSDGFDTQDLELDLLLHTDGRVEWKDDDLLDLRVRDGRLTEAQARDVRREARRLEAELATRGHWWHSAWALWEPDPAWDVRFEQVKAQA